MFPDRGATERLPCRRSEMDIKFAVSSYGVHEFCRAHLDCFIRFFWIFGADQFVGNVPDIFDGQVYKMGLANFDQPTAGRPIELKFNAASQECDRQLPPA